MIEPEKKAEYTEFLQSEQGQNILLLAGFGQKDTIMKNNLLNLMADVLHPERQDEIYFHPNIEMKPVDLTQSTPAALQGACKSAKFDIMDLLDSREIDRLKRLKRR